MKLADFFSTEEIQLELRSTSKDEALVEMVALLRLEARAQQMLLSLLKKREALGSTGIGSGVAIPHSRSLVVDRLRLAFGRKREGLAYEAMDGKPVRFLFLIVAPPLEISNQYLPVLGRIAQFCKNQENLERLDRVESPQDFLQALEAAEA